MDAQARKKSLFRAKLNAQKKDKRIDSPLVRYNESDQPVCRVCDVVMKSESYWDAHQASRKHHEAIRNLKANAGVSQVENAKPEPSVELPKPKSEGPVELHNPGPPGSRELPRSQLSSGLPPDFFDNNDSQKPKRRAESVTLVEPDISKKSRGSTQVMEPLNLEHEKYGLPSHSIAQSEAFKLDKQHSRTSTQNSGSEAKQVKGALPEGFFDNKEDDLRARGIKPVKPDVKDEYKEFEKLIQEDLQEVDDRMEEEEFDAAETIEEAESVEQRSYRGRVELLRKKKMELKAARSFKQSGDSKVVRNRTSTQESSSDDDSDENFAVDWRAQHL
ncbi:protein ABA AND ROS SENSITIVE 1 isoform X1 [Ziziphus jujuba]|uniref:Zinc finger protein 830 n=3 Tax=Ziziphus jujuba TaxID=326968 RepID=A0A6P4A0M8_ZIZJJ|nr:protein ABA AND ROS SENSITIVE 1 isoform X1 [Ziziphus jujuba]KAH7533261.1 hypothetical protein FEM48_Zijuj04G0111900 [Ziziphus jujuba var. spinosa]